MKNYLSLILFFCLSYVHIFGDTYVWEDYDDFSGSSLDTSKWDVGYFSGGEAASTNEGVAILSGSGYTGSDLENVPSIWQTAAAQSTGQSNSGIFVKEMDIYGIEVEVSISSSGNSQNVGFIVETHPADGSTYNGIELAWRENGLHWSYENENPSNAQISELSQEADFDTSYTVSVIHTGSRMELHINGTRVANLNSNFTPNHWLIGSFNDDGKIFNVSIDNVRILRHSSSDSLDGSTLFLDSDDPVTLTLAFENGTITSTFEDGGEDSGTVTGNLYDYIIVDQNRFSITEKSQLDGTYITFDQSTGRGKLFDFKSDGQLDESGTWDFTFETISTSRVAISDPNSLPVVVQVGEDYQWNDTLNGVTLWGVGYDNEELNTFTFSYSASVVEAALGLVEQVTNPLVSQAYTITEEGYLEHTESSGPQYFKVHSVEDGKIVTTPFQDKSEASSSTDPHDTFFTTRSAAEEFYNSKLHYAPSSLLGKTIYIPEEGFVANYSFTEDEAYYVIPLSLDQVEGIPYSYVANTSTTATLTLARETGDVIHQISFSSPTTADSNWTDLESNETGSATLQILTEDYWPSTLAGWSYQGTSMNDTFYFVDEGHVVFYDASDSNFSNRELSNITYTWEQIGPRIGKLTTSLGEETLLFFESNTSGFFDWEEIGSDDGSSGQFDLFYYPSGKAFESLVGSSISIGDTTYVFTSTNAVTVHSPSGTSSQEYAYLRENEDEVLLSVGSSLYKLDFYNHQYGRIIEGGSGYFSIHQNWATKGWVYYDELPWIYSNNQGEWLYQVLSVNSDSNNTELMFFEPWSNQWSQNLDLNFTDQRVFPADSEFYWEDYDDFNGTELNSTKWDVAWWDGAQPGNIENGKLTLSGTGNSYSPAQVNPQGADAVIAKMFENGGDDERPNMHSFAQVISGEIHGISAKIMIPNDAPVETGIGIVGFQFNPDGTKYSMDIELGYWFEGGPLELAFENEDPPVGEGAEVSNYEYVLGEWVDVSIIHTPTLGYLMLNDEVVLEFETTYNPNWYGFYAFNDQDPNWKEYKTYVDNVRVLRKKSHPQGWMWTEYYPWAYSHETGAWLYFELAKDSAGNPVMNYYDHNTKAWDLYGPSLNQFYDR